MPTLPQPSQLIECNNLSSCLQNLYNLIFAIFVAMAFLYFLFGAFEYLLSGANIFPKESGRNKMKNSIISLIIVLTIPIVLNMINPGIFNAQLQIPHVTTSPVEMILSQPYYLRTSNSPQGFVKIKLGDIIDKAKTAAEGHSIKPAFLLAIFFQETRFGKGLGGCKVKQPVEFVYPPGKKMLGVRLVTPSDKLDGYMSQSNFVEFKNITGRLGRDPYNTPVSCARGSSPWGGAMGYLQVMPSTWSNFASENQDPWNLEDALDVGATYLAHLIEYAKGKNPNLKEEDLEKLAAMGYFGGPPAMLNPSEEHKNYAKSVMANRKKFQNILDDLEKSKQK